MKYYSEETVNEMLLYLARSRYFPIFTFYPSIEIPDSPWHTGTPTEEGDYLLLVDKETPRYTLGRWSGHWEFPNQDFVIKWQKIEP